MNTSGIMKVDWKRVVENFHKMNLKEDILRGIYEYGFEKPLVIQQPTILQCSKGHDVTVQAQFGTGKTTSVVISILQQINNSLNECQALILVPSFELARQIQKVVIELGKFMKVDCHACLGVEHIHDYVCKVDTFPHVVVGTPACVNDLIYRHLLRTQFIKIIVLEGANLLLYRRYKSPIKEVFKSLEEDTQVILVSNKIHKNALDQSTEFVSNPVRICMQKEEQTLEAFKQFYINNSQKNETQDGRSSETNDYFLQSETPSMDSSRVIECNRVDNFQDINLKDKLLHGIYECGFEKPSAIQQCIILSCIKGHNVIVQGQRGIGKISSVLISILQQIDTNLNECQALILAPSRKLALQIQKVVIALGYFMDAECLTGVGGKTIPNNRLEMNTFPHVVVGTPPYISDLIIRKCLCTQFIKIFVLEEANLLFSRGNTVQIKEVFKSLDENNQVILLSNGMSKKALNESTHFVSNPVHIFMPKDELTLDSNLEGIKYFFVNFTHESYKFDSLCDLFDTLSITQVVIFCNTCNKVEWLTENMRLKAFNISAMHREMDLQKNSITLFRFLSGFVRVLITTHMFVRTIDLQKLSLVINFDLPSDYENFIHNIESSHYVARKGVIINFITEDGNQATETNHYSGPIITVDSGTIEYDWNDAVDNFHEMNLKEELLRGIYEYGFEKPLAIQQRTILPCIKGHDVIVQAQPGTGKTTSVLISILQQIDKNLNECQALILAPSRKLALQIQKVVITLGNFMKADCYTCIHGINTLDTFPHVVVGTPICVYELIVRKCLQTKFIKIFVLDDTNKLLNHGIKYQINEMFNVLEKDVQIIVLSDQMPKNVLDMTTDFLRNPVRILMQNSNGFAIVVQSSIHRIPISSFLFGIMFNKISTLPISYMSFMPSARLRFFNSL